MIAWLRRISSATSNEYSAVFCLNWAESDGNIEINIQKFSCLFVSLNIIKGQDPLIKFKEMDPVGGTLITEPLELVRIAQLIETAHPNSST